MSRVRLFRVYDLLFLLNKKHKIYCLNNSINSSTNNLVHDMAVKERLALFPSSVAAATDPEPGGFAWAGVITADKRTEISWIDWLIAGDQADVPGLQSLLDFFAQEAGEAGNKYLGAVIDTGYWFINSFRLCGFAVYARQAVWHFNSGEYNEPKESSWMQVREQAFDAADVFYQAHTAPINRQIDRLTKNQNIYILWDDNKNIIGRVKASESNGHCYLEPVFHPSVENASKKLIDLARQLVWNRPAELHVTVSGFESWLQSDLSDIGFELERQQTVMVKSLAQAVKDEQDVAVFSSSSSVNLGYKYEREKKA